MKEIKSRVNLVEVLRFAVEMQESVEAAKEPGYGEPADTTAWLDWAKDVIQRFDSGESVHWVEMP